MIPENLRYTRTHEWARLDEADKTVTVGLTDFAVEQLGDVVYLELPSVGQKVQKESAMGVIESVKAASDIYAPVSGEVIEVNSAVTENFDLLKQDAYGNAWLVKIKPDNDEDFATLLSAQDYKNLLSEQEH